MAIKVTVGSRQAANVVSAKSKIKVGKLEENVGNLDVGDGLSTGETLVYNATTQKWEALSLAEQVASAVSEQITDSVSSALNSGSVVFDGGDY